MEFVTAFITNYPVWAWIIGIGIVGFVWVWGIFKL